MSKFINHSLLVCLPLQLIACGSDTPVFQEKPQAIIKVAVNKADDPSQMSGESFDMETLGADGSDESIGSSADAVVGNAGERGASENNFTKPGSSRDVATVPNRAPSEGNPGAGQSSNAQPISVPDAKAVAKACAPAMRNLGQPLTVLNVQSSNTAITISPNSVVALRITGDRTKVVLDLDGTLPLGGVCFFLAGHETELEFTTAASLRALAIVEAGDEAKAQITLNGGSSESLSVDLRGHAPSLSIQGVDAELCEQARPRSANATFSCQP